MLTILTEVKRWCRLLLRLFDLVRMVLERKECSVCFDVFSEFGGGFADVASEGGGEIADGGHLIGQAAQGLFRAEINKEVAALVKFGGDLIETVFLGGNDLRSFRRHRNGGRRRLVLMATGRQETC